MQGPDALAAVLAQLEGFEAPAGAWETEVIPARITEYEPQWLDEHCRAGRFVWTRLARARGRSEERARAAPLRSAPRPSCCWRGAMCALWSSLVDQSDPEQLTSKAQAVADFIHAHGASFFDEIAEDVGMLPREVEEALAELVALGIVNSDSFGGLRVLVDAERPARPIGNSWTGRRKRRLALFAHGGRGALGAGAPLQRAASSGARG